MILFLFFNYPFASEIAWAFIRFDDKAFGSGKRAPERQRKRESSGRMAWSLPGCFFEDARVCLEMRKLRERLHITNCSSGNSSLRAHNLLRGVVRDAFQSTEQRGTAESLYMNP